MFLKRFKTKCTLFAHFKHTHIAETVADEGCRKHLQKMQVCQTPAKCPKREAKQCKS